MQMFSINRERSVFRSLCVSILLAVLLVTGMMPMQVRAAPTDKYKPIEHMVVVSDCDWFLNELKTALRNEEATDGGNSLGEYNQKEMKDHKFVKWGSGNWVDDVRNGVNDLEKEDEGVAVIFWMGFDIVDDTTTFTHDKLVKTFLSDYQKEMVDVEVPVDPDDPSKGTTTVQQESTSTELQYKYSIEQETCWTKAAQRYSDEIRANGLNDFLTNRKINAYWIGLPPNKGYDDEPEYYTSLKNADGSEKAISELYGFWAEKWNEALSAAGRNLDIWEAAAESKLYFTGTKHMLGDGYHGSSTHGGGSGTDSGVWSDADANHGLSAEKTTEAKVGDHEYNSSYAAHARSDGYAFYSFDEQTYQTLFHIIFNQVQLMNPRPESGDAISQDLYSVSASLTSYVNNVLSMNADEKHSDHEILKTGSVGNAGGLLGYGDEEYDFTSDIITKLSSTSSFAAYDALKLDDGQLDNTLQYARYGRLLADMGLDSYGIKHTVGSGRLISGGFMLIVYVLSLLCSKLFGIFIDLMILLNPFRFFINVGGSMGSALTDVVKDSDSILSSSASAITTHPAFKAISDLMSGVYTSLTKWSWGIVIPLGLAFLICSLFVYSKLFNNDKPAVRVKKVSTWLLRVAFVAIGVPLLGCIYTSVLSFMDYTTDDTKCASTQMVASTYVDFGKWASNLRLDPVSGGRFVSDISVQAGGEADVKTLAKLRDTALAINKKSGTIDGVSKLSASSEDALQWSLEVLDTSASSSESAINQCYELLMGYISDNFYYPSDWESAVGSSMAANSSIDMGRRQGGEEEQFDADALQGEKTVYNMFDSTNETSDWLDRETDDNTEIFSRNTKWNPFNIFRNGGKITHDSVNGNTVKYTSTYTSSKLGSDPTATGGLSTMSMYNYLTSKFSSDGVTIYSNRDAVNIQSKYSHYAVNSIGSGALGVLYYANALVLMLIVSIIGLCYVFASMMNVIKKGMTVFMSIPGASLGVLKSIATILSTTFSMIVELVMIGFLYMLISQLLVAFVNVLQNVLSGGNVITVIGGVTAEIGNVGILEHLFSSGWLLYGNLVLTSLVMIVFGVYAWKYRRAYQRVTCHVRDLAYVKLLPSSVVKNMGVVGMPKIPVFTYIHTFLCDIKAMLQTTELQFVED